MLPDIVRCSALFSAPPRLVGSRCRSIYIEGKPMPVTLSLPEARRLAIAAQGFGERLPKPSIAHLRRLIARLHAFQIDSVNVLVRAHYVPAFARLGPYRMETLDSLAYDKRELFEYWGHAACLLPVSLYPLVRYRMHKHTERTQEY